MSDEQTIYINPEDNLTTVREHLEQSTSQRIALVIPGQTELRSSVAWQNLYRRAHELDKDVLIISSDAQIRSVAQAAQFRVAHSQQATSPTDRARAANRLGRRSATTRNRTPVTPPRSTPMRNAPNMQSVRNVQNPDGIDNAYQGSSVADLERARDSRAPHEDDAPTSGSISTPASSTFGDQHYSRPSNFRDTVPPIMSLSPEHMLEEPDSFSEDLNQARDIRRAAREGHEESNAQVVGEPLQTHSMTDLPNEKQDPFIDMQDSLRPSIPEQRGSASVDVDADEYSIPDPSHSPTYIVDGEVEYQGDQGDIVIHFDTPEPPPRSVSDPIPEDTQDTAGPAHMFPMRRGRNSRSTQLPPQTDLESQDALPAVEADRLIQPTPAPSTRSPSRQLASASNSEAVSQQKTPAQRNQARRAPRQTGHQRAAQAGRAAGTPARPTAARRPTAQRRDMGANSILIALVILLLLLLGSLVYFGPSATVTLTLFSQNFSTPVKLVASASRAKGTVLGNLHTMSFNKSEVGKATGTTKVGTAQATGTVTFTNNGTDPLEIPTGTVVSTSKGVQFVTTIDVVVQVKTSSLGNTIPIPVQAEKQGEGGNVAAGSITIIPDSSLSAIATYDKLSVTSLKLQVTNATATSGGGVGTASAVTADDLKTAQATLHTQLAIQIAAWVKSQLAPGDIASNPTMTETVTNTAQVGQIPSNAGTFPMTLSINVKVLVVPNATIQREAIAQLDDALPKKQAGYIIAPDTNVAVSQVTTTGDANSLTLDFTATGKAVPNINKQEVQSLIVGKSLTDAKSLLKTANVEHVDIQVSPSFDTFVPWWTGHINVKIVAGTTQPTK